MKKLSSFSQFIGESNTTKNIFLEKFVDDCIEKGMEAKYEFKGEYPYLSEDSDRLFEEFVKIKGLLDFYNEFVEYNSQYNQILENNTREAAKLVKNNDVGVFDLLNNDGDYKHDDKYLTVVDGVVISFNDDELPTNNRGFLEFFFYDLLLMSNDFYWFMSVFHFDDGFDKETNWNRMKTYYITRPFFDIMYDMYVKMKENEE
jgi:hypothetical protein